LLPPKAQVLDLGCGSGLPVAGFLAKRGFEVLGLDISPRQVGLARRKVPAARFEVADMQGLTAGEYHVDGVVALYSIFHIDRREHGRLLSTLRSFLPAHGALLITMGASDWEGTDADFLGAEMSWSHYGPSRNRELVEAAGFTVRADEIDRSGGEEHQVILAQV
jgi:cyclopropane fatty-acyl-phospholipid synthase-like methyltransferase